MTTTITTVPSATSAPSAPAGASSAQPAAIAQAAGQVLQLLQSSQQAILNHPSPLQAIEDILPTALQLILTAFSSLTPDQLKQAILQGVTSWVQGQTSWPDGEKQMILSGVSAAVSALEVVEDVAEAKGCHCLLL